jgi:gas vesicle protein
VSTALVAGLFGVFGTVVGGVLTTWTARQAADRSAQHAREDLHRQECRSAVAQFATALGVYRTAEMDRWHAKHGGFRDEKSAAADVYSARTVARNALHVLELSTDNQDLCERAQRAYDRAENIKDPDSQAEMDRRADQVDDDLAEMITIARLELSRLARSLSAGRSPGPRHHPRATHYEGVLVRCSWVQSLR